MPVSSVSDFEHFAEKVKKQISTKVRRVEVETSDYLLAKENEAEHKINSWTKHAHFEWDQERYAQEQRSHNSIEEEVNRKWSEFKKERKSALRSALKIRLYQIFPTLAECFISQISQKYQTGTLTMPEAYMSFVTKEGFLLHMCEKEQIIFTSGNLYIEYSVERIIEELTDEIDSRMHFKEDTWQV
ncbi:hypothetical protein ACLHDG_10390 [Sulfurovum sp. CS9]|uniref:hypothetical protein n=1 Tax=Sulfurovum sp. CS9 TaxID=3391146 RepID=UPI0039EC4CA8